MLARAAIYLDANAGTPLSIAAREAIFPLLFEASGEGTTTRLSSRSLSPLIIPNPSSVHSHGRKARAGLNGAREKIAFSFGQGTHPDEITFTSSGTEAGQLAIRKVLETELLKGAKPHWILTAVEHDAHLQMIEWLEARGGSVSRLPVDDQGSLLLDRLDGLFRPETALVSAIWVNNETGVISDIAKLSRKAREREVPLHLDGAQAWGKLPINLTQTGAAFVSFSAHKIGGLSGTGVLWTSREWSKSQDYNVASATSILGKQESGRRGGTENILGVIALGAAAASLNTQAWSDHVLPLREWLEAEVLRSIPGARIHGQAAARVANTINFGFEGIEKDGLVMALDLAGFSVSSGSACSSGTTQPSHVLQAMGLSTDQARAAVRVSLPADTQAHDLKRFAEVLSQSVQKLRLTR